MIILPGLTAEQTSSIIPDNTLLLGYVGSISHGTKIPKTDPDCIDDIDIMGICAAPKSCYLGLGKFEQKCVQQGEWDSVVYEIRKFFKLLLQQNPNVLGLLWLRDFDYLHISGSAQNLIKNRHLFSSKKAYASFIGYAHAQLKKMTHNACEGYMGARRKALVDKFGYGLKNASHLIRLLRQGIEFLETEKINVFRHDAAQLIEIKQGKWTLEQVKDESEKLFSAAEYAYKNTFLPEEPNYSEAEELLMSILEEELWMS